MLLFLIASVKFIKLQEFKSTANAGVSQNPFFAVILLMHSKRHLHYVEF